MGHARQMITAHSFAPGNASFIFWYDVFAPLVVGALYLATG